MNKISVCVATYNGEKYIKRQLMSIVDQLHADDEIIVSDDISTDETISIIQSFNDERISIYTNTKSLGPAKNFEQALIRATGDIILLADQDDIWYNNKVEIMRDLLDKFDLVLSDCTVIDSHYSIIHKSFFKHRGSKRGFWYNFYKNSYIGCCMGFRRETLSYTTPFPNNIYMHDWWIGLLVELKGEVCLYPKPLIYYVRHGSNASPTGEGGHGLKLQFFNRLFLLRNVVIRLLDSAFRS